MKVSLQCVSTLRSFVAQDDDALAFLTKNDGKFVTAELKAQRSPEHNRMFWAVATRAHFNLPERFRRWQTAHDMVKGLQLAFGITDQVLKPVKGGGMEVHEQPRSLDFGNMDQQEFNDVSSVLFKGMAHCLGVTVDELLGEN